MMKGPVAQACIVTSQAPDRWTYGSSGTAARRRGVYLDRRADDVAGVTGPDGRDLLRVRWSLQLGEVGALLRPSGPR